MTDKEVGEAFKETHIFGTDYNDNGATMRSYHLKIQMRKVISKLVIERADSRYYEPGGTGREGIEYALIDFGINKKDWELYWGDQNV